MLIHAYCPKCTGSYNMPGTGPSPGDIAMGKTDVLHTLRLTVMAVIEASVEYVSLVVNVASECGFTDQHYRALQQLQRDLGPHHFNVLAFPCNQFGQQEPDSNKEIENFARRTYSVSFPMFSKVAVTGTGAHPAYKYLTETSGKEPTWNFWKYLVAPDGKVVGAWDPTVSVEEIKPHIKALVRKLILQKREDL
ncbi:glutathione peroxidase 7 [Tupaia chinensis]|uniref:glutathione peroxidase 7 n=1 Tax=Tupaia chinensis TaxID=246437 RepID=UPI00070436D7|nr:glutathione peroxidase 7 [Tupaia chinensis]